LPQVQGDPYPFSSICLSLYASPPPFHLRENATGKRVKECTSNESWTVSNRNHGYQELKKRGNERVGEGLRGSKQARGGKENKRDRIRKETNKKGRKGERNLNREKRARARTLAEPCGALPLQGKLDTKVFPTCIEFSRVLQRKN